MQKVHHLTKKKIEQQAINDFINVKLKALNEAAIDTYLRTNEMGPYAPVKEVVNEGLLTEPPEFITTAEFNNLTGQLYDRILDSVSVASSEDIRFKLDTALVHLRAFNRVVTPLLHT